jgi:hypothetical protein
MQLTSISNWLEQATQPQHPYYHPIQVALSAGISYVGTACLTSISPKRGMMLIISAYAISQLITPLFCKLFEPYQDISLVPLFGQILQIAASLVLAKVVCQLAGQTLTFKEAGKVGLVFIPSLCATRWILIQF